MDISKHLEILLIWNIIFTMLWLHATKRYKTVQFTPMKDAKYSQKKQIYLVRQIDYRMIMAMFCLFKGQII